MISQGRAGPLDWAVAAQPIGESLESGDAALVVPFPGGALVAVIDGLGHGREAALASAEAVRILSEQPALPVEELLLRCHAGLRRTRGAVISLASVADSGAMSWLGVGNVEVLAVTQRPPPQGPRLALAARGGVVGYQLPTLRTAHHELAPGDVLFAVTDGIRHDFMSGLELAQSPRALADRILASSRKVHDDALALVARFAGATP